MENTGNYIHKRHNVSVIIYHYVCPAKYRRIVVSDEVDMTIKEACIEIEKRYDICLSQRIIIPVIIRGSIQ